MKLNLLMSYWMFVAVLAGIVASSLYMRTPTDWSQVTSFAPLSMWQDCFGQEGAQAPQQEAACTKIIDLNSEPQPAVLIALNNRAVAYWRQKDVRRAVRDIDHVLFFEPDFASALINRGNIIGGLQCLYDRPDCPFNPQQAERDLTKAAGIAPSKVVDVFLNRGIARSFNGKWEAALQDFNSALAIDSRDVGVLHERAIYYLHKDAYQSVIKDCDEAISIKSNDAIAFTLKGTALIFTGNYAAAMSSLDIATTLDGSGSSGLDVWAARAYAKALSGDLEGAIAELHQHDQDTRSYFLLQNVEAMRQGTRRLTMADLNNALVPMTSISGPRPSLALPANVRTAVSQ